MHNLQEGNIKNKKQKTKGAREYDGLLFSSTKSQSSSMPTSRHGGGMALMNLAQPDLHG